MLLIPVFRYLKNQLEKLHVMFACDDVPIIDFKNNYNLKLYLVRAALHR